MYIERDEQTKNVAVVVVVDKSVADLDFSKRIKY